MEPHGQSPWHSIEIPSYACLREAASAKAAKASEGYPPVAKSTEALNFGHGNHLNYRLTHSSTGRTRGLLRRWINNQSGYVSISFTLNLSLVSTVFRSLEKMSMIFEKGICAQVIFKTGRIPEGIYGLIRILLRFESIVFSVEWVGERSLPACIATHDGKGLDCPFGRIEYGDRACRKPLN